MNSVLVRLAAVAMAGHFLGSWGNAQLVDVQPGYVKAPFVRVYTYPDGSSYVRAPLVNIFSPGYDSGYYSSAPPRPSGLELAQMDCRTLRQTARTLARDFDGQLDSIATGATWKDYLKTAELRERLRNDRDNEGPPTRELVGTLQEIRQRMDVTRSTPAYDMIANLDSFRALDAALGELLTPSELRLRRQLATDGTELRNSLNGMAAEAGWSQYLALPPGLAASVPEEPNSPPPSPGDVAIALQRYDLVAQNSGFRVIAQLPGFEATRKHLAEYNALLKGTEVSHPVAEELSDPHSAQPAKR